MFMTHYMELLASNQPWNLILFMAIPVILAETVAITELFVLFARPEGGPLLVFNRWASIAGGIYFIGVFAYLVPNVVTPLTTAGQWRGAADMLAVGFYLAGVIPLAGMALLDAGVIGRQMARESRLKLHAGFVAGFLVVAHVAMIFGMMDPSILGATQEAAVIEQSGHHH